MGDLILLKRSAPASWQGNWKLLNQNIVSSLPPGQWVQSNYGARCFEHWLHRWYF